MKQRHIIAIVLAVLAMVGSVFYLLSQDTSQTPTEQEPAVQQEQQPLPEEETTAPVIKEPTVSKQPEEQLLSEEELTALWPNSDRCSEEDFFEPDSTPVPEPGELFLNFVRVTFTEDVACEDIESIAILIGAKITGGVIRYNKYGFELTTKTLEDLEKAIIKIENLENKKIISAQKVTYTDSFVDF